MKMRQRRHRMRPAPGPRQARIMKRWTSVGGLRVFTTFIGVGHGVSLDAPPLFEILALVGGKPVYLRRYHTWAEAEAGHAQTVARLAKDAGA